MAGWLTAAVAAVGVLAGATTAQAGFTFTSIDGGTIDMDSFRGRPVLVVNTASLCGFAPQFTELQQLQDEFGPRGLVVLAVPSDDFRQELGSAKEVKQYCAMQFDVSLPMTDITHVTGPAAHPFYIWLRDETGFTPRWNFNKVLIGPNGEVLATWGSTTKPTSTSILSKIEPLLN